MYEKFFKRLLDIVLSFLALIVLSWLYLALIIAIKIDDPGPAFFTQKRVGIHKSFFKLHKFRSGAFVKNTLTSTKTQEAMY